jgi:hypothetical protein
MRVSIDGQDVPAPANLGEALDQAMAWADERGRAVSQVRVDGKILTQARIDRMAGRAPKVVEFATRDRREWAAELLRGYLDKLRELETMPPGPEAHEAWTHVTSGLQINVLSLGRLDLRGIELPGGARAMRVYQAITDALTLSKGAFDRGDGAGSARILEGLRGSIPAWRQALQAVGGRLGSSEAR